MTVDELLGLRGTSRADMESLPDVTVDPDVSYSRLQHVDRLHAPSLSPAHFYFFGPELKLVYAPAAAVGTASAREWLERVGPGPQLRSRTGKRAIFEIRPELGLAFAHEDDVVGLAEAFPPTTLEAYETEIYEEPPAFIR